MNPMHLDEEQVQRALHRELGAAEASARSHLRSCPACRSRVAEAEREESWVFDRLRLLDHAAPRVSAATLAPSAGPRVRGWDRVAAGVLLALAVAGVAYAAPGFPFHGVVHRIVELVRQPAGHTPPPAGPREPPSQTGIAVSPGDRLVIEFAEQPHGAVATVSLADGGDVVVRALGAATFTSDVERLFIEHGGSAQYEILIPRAAPSVEIRVRGRRVFLKEASRLVVDAHPDGEGRYLVPLSMGEP